MKALAGAVCDECVLPGLQMAVATWGQREAGEQLGSSSPEDACASVGPPPQRGAMTSLMPSRGAVRASAYEFSGDTNMHSITME